LRVRVKMGGFVGVNSVHLDACVTISWHSQFEIVPTDHSDFKFSLVSMTVSLFSPLELAVAL
jgi:hypothetical protein